MTMTPYSGDITRSLKWLQNNAPRIQSIIQQKADWYSKYNDAFWTNWQENVFDIRTANAFGLVVWCIILGIPLSTFNFQPNTNAFAFGPQRGNFLDGGGNTAPISFVDTPVFYANGTPVSSSSYTLNATAGTITYSTAPATGTQLSWTATVQQPETAQHLTITQPRVFGTGNGTATTFSIIPSNSAHYNEVGFNFYGGGAQNVGLLNEIRYACQLRYVALVSNGRQQWINQMLNYIFNGGQPWDFPNKKYFYLTDNTIAIQNVMGATVWSQYWEGNQQQYTTPRTNLLTYSQSFENTGAWTSTGLTVTTAAATAPDSSAAGEKITDTTNATQSRSLQCANVSASAAQAVTASVFAKASDRGFLIVRAVSADNPSNYCYGVFDLVNGVVLQAGNAGTASLASGSIQNIGNGWYKCAISGVPDTSGAHIAMLIAAPLTNTSSTSYTGIPGQGIYVWGAQLETGAVPTSYIHTTSAAITTTDYVLNASTGAVTFAVAPLNGAVLTWMGTWNWATTPAPQSFGTGNGSATAFTLSQPPGAAKPITTSMYMEYRVGANLKLSSQFLNILNNPTIGIMPTCAGVKYAVVQES